MVEQRPAHSLQFRDYRIYLDPKKLIKSVQRDLDLAEKTLQDLETTARTTELKNKDFNEKVRGYRTRLNRANSLTDYERSIEGLNLLTKEYAKNPTIENARALKIAASSLENRVAELHSILVAEAGAKDKPAKELLYSSLAVILANSQLTRTTYSDGRPFSLKSTTFRNNVFGYGKNAGPARQSMRDLDILNSPAKMEQFFAEISSPKELQKALLGTAKTTSSTGSGSVSTFIPKPVVKINGSATKITAPKSIIPASSSQLLLPPPRQYPKEGPYLPQSLTSSMQAIAQGFQAGAPSSQVAPITFGRWGTHPATNGITGTWTSPASWVKPNYSTPFGNAVWQRLHPKPTMFTDYSYDSKANKEKRSLIKSIEILYRPLINLVKGLGDIAKEAKHMELAMSSLASALGNPFEESTLAAITDFSSAGANTAIGGFGAIGGTISSVGGGIGRMANDTWNLRGKGVESAGGGKFGGVLTAISAAMGVVGGAISAVAGIVSAGFGMANTLLKSINKITLKILSTSPLFETIKNILNLAFTMAFLPAMTLLQGKLLPIFTGLLKSMTDFGSKFASLFTETRITLITDAFKGIIGSIVGFFDSHKEQLAEMITQMILILPAMMKMQLGIIELFVNNKDKILNLINKTIDVLSKFIDQGLFDKLLVFINKTLTFIDDFGIPLADAILSIAGGILPHGGPSGLEGAQVAGAHTSPASNPIARGVMMILGAAGIHFASGGYVPATPGGVPAIIGEGGEGEYVIPESKLNSIGGLTVVFSGTVYGMNDFKQQVRSIMNEYTTKANFR